MYLISATSLDTSVNICDGQTTKSYHITSDNAGEPTSAINYRL